MLFFWNFSIVSFQDFTRDLSEIYPRILLENLSWIHFSMSFFRSDSCDFFQKSSIDSSWNYSQVCSRNSISDSLENSSRDYIINSFRDTFTKFFENSFKKSSFDVIQSCSLISFRNSIRDCSLRNSLRYSFKNSYRFFCTNSSRDLWRNVSRDCCKKTKIVGDSSRGSSRNFYRDSSTILGTPAEILPEISRENYTFRNTSEYCYFSTFFLGFLRRNPFRNVSSDIFKELLQHFCFSLSNFQEIS